MQQRVLFIATLITTLISIYFISIDTQKSEPLTPRKKYEVPQGAKETYIIFLSGLDSHCDGTRYNQMGFEYLRRQLARTGLSFKDEHFLKYSYTGGKLRGGRWYPNPYGPLDTGQAIQFSVMQLKEMIDEFTICHPRARFILVGHSLGGRIAFDYVSSYHSEKPGIIKGVVTLNAPLAGSAHTTLNMLSVFKPLWGTPAVNQLVAEYRLRNESGILKQKIETARMLNAEGVFLATFGTRQDMVVNPFSACLTDRKGYPLTKGSIISVNPLSGNFHDLFGHRQILSHNQVADYVISVYTFPDSKPLQ